MKDSPLLVAALVVKEMGDLIKEPKKIYSRLTAMATAKFFAIVVILGLIGSSLYIGGKLSAKLGTEMYLTFPMGITLSLLAAFVIVCIFLLLKACYLALVDVFSLYLNKEKGSEE